MIFAQKNLIRFPAELIRNKQQILYKYSVAPSVFFFKKKVIYFTGGQNGKDVKSYSVKLDCQLLK